MFLKSSAHVFSVSFLLTAFLLTAYAETRTRQQVEQELARVESNLSAAQEGMANQSKALWQKQHDLEYSDPGVAKLREEIVTLEKSLVEKRRELSDKLSVKPEMKQIEKERRQLFDRLESLRLEEEALKNEVAALDNASAFPK